MLFTCVLQFSREEVLNLLLIDRLFGGPEMQAGQDTTDWELYYLSLTWWFIVLFLFSFLDFLSSSEMENSILNFISLEPWLQPENCLQRLSLSLNSSLYSWSPGVNRPLYQVMLLFSTYLYGSSWVKTSCLPLPLSACQIHSSNISNHLNQHLSNISPYNASSGRCYRCPFIIIFEKHLFSLLKKYIV